METIAGVDSVLHRPDRGDPPVGRWTRKLAKDLDSGGDQADERSDQGLAKESKLLGRTKPCSTKEYSNPGLFPGGRAFTVSPSSRTRVEEGAFGPSAIKHVATSVTRWVEALPPPPPEPEDLRLGNRSRLAPGVGHGSGAGQAGLFEAVGPVTDRSHLDVVVILKTASSMAVWGGVSASPNKARR